MDLENWKSLDLMLAVSKQNKSSEARGKPPKDCQRTKEVMRNDTKDYFFVCCTLLSLPLLSILQMMVLCTAKMCNRATLECIAALSCAQAPHPPLRCREFLWENLLQMSSALTPVYRQFYMNVYNASDPSRLSTHFTCTPLHLFFFGHFASFNSSTKHCISMSKQIRSGIWKSLSRPIRINSHLRRMNQTGKCMESRQRCCCAEVKCIKRR